jgi:hypothetical protein
MAPSRRSSFDEHDSEIDFERFAKPIFRDGCCFFPAQLRGSPVKVGVAEEVLLALGGRTAEDSLPQ